MAFFAMLYPKFCLNNINLLFFKIYLVPMTKETCDLNTCGLHIIRVALYILYHNLYFMFKTINTDYAKTDEFF